MNKKQKDFTMLVQQKACDGSDLIVAVESDPNGAKIIRGECMGTRIGYDFECNFTLESGNEAMLPVLVEAIAELLAQQVWMASLALGGMVWEGEIFADEEMEVDGEQVASLDSP